MDPGLGLLFIQIHLFTNHVMPHLVQSSVSFLPVLAPVTNRHDNASRQTEWRPELGRMIMPVQDKE